MSTSRNAQPIAIAGGGIGGLACALALARRGFRALVLEQAREFGEVGVGLQVAPNALSVLDALGVGLAAKKHALLIERLLMMDAVTGEEVANVPCGARFIERFGNPYAVSHRADIHGALLDACRAHELIELRNDCRVLDFDLEKPGVSVALDGGERVGAAALVGADGVSSNVRQRIVGDGEPPPAGAVIFRATIPASDMPKDLQHAYPTFWAGPGWHVIYYPLRDWSLFNLGCTVVADRLEFRDGEDVSPDRVLPRFSAGCETPLRAMRIPTQYRHFVIRHREPVENWTMGPVTLLGDAAHPMVQYIAQGAAMALEDAICLAGAAHECDGDFARAFQRYQDIRIVRTARVQISSLMMDRLNHAKGVERKVRNSLFEGRTAEEYYDRLAWLYTAPPYVR
ncbi:MAG: 3-hydroxybenzoate 6-monooxygenase [Alphaproteobacteria bacterium]|jgi:salicylate hydroxylase|nr:3-hydroxybenzoate 6-monooxygenase [Alphaproteobacteria bacterium]